ncbi:site-specific DNA-methyltransferase [Acidiphilium iwatense]|uniref:site-specific DNA-methyltransferase (adenine-specific) n=1 Tax=Acidiphilium iwatense TaxID=768198 RepID=A0ABS9E0A1_9PROT|nr:site-specific DNA-methyltransferase [Acidiphilium iwatense]
MFTPILPNLRDRLTVMRDLLTESGSIFVQIGDENVHRVRAVMDEVFGEDNFLSLIAITKGATGLSASGRMPARLDYIIWYARRSDQVKYRQLFMLKSESNDPNFPWVILPSGERRRRTEFERDGALLPENALLGQDVSLTKPGPGAKYEVEHVGRKFSSGSRWWGTTKPQLERALKTNRIIVIGNSLRHLRYLHESSLTAIGNLWDGFLGQNAPVYVVQTNTDLVQRCILMATDPGDLVLDPTCGSGTTAYVAEQWGRRWITMDTSRVALALARTRLMAARYPWYLLADSREGRAKEAELTKRPPADTPLHNDIRQGFVYERVPHITLKSIANNKLIDDIWEKFQAVLEPLRATLNASLPRSGEGYAEWEIPREVDPSWSQAARAAHEQWWEARIARQREIDASIAARADVEFLYDKPYTDNARVRVAGPFTVESLSPHRVLPASEDELLGDAKPVDASQAGQDFSAIVIDYLKSEGVKQEQKNDRITFESLTPWPGNYIGASGIFIEGENGPERRAAILIGPEYGTVGRQDIVAAAREAVDARFDVLIACAFNFDAHSTELGSLGSLKILKARINPDMHMSAELKNTGRGNMFVVFGEPDVEILDDGSAEIRVKVNGVDVFDPNTGDIRSNDTKGIAAWFIDTDYNEESFFVRHAYFLGANDPYKSLKTALQAEIDEDAWATLYADTSRPFPRPARGRIAVKVINHFGDEVMKIFGV